MDKEKEHQYLQDCLQQIEAQLGWGSSTHWHSTVFKELSESIQDKTEVVLSPTTLKRVWGRVNYQGTPSISTLNTLARFLGYNNWRAFKSESDILKDQSAIPTEVPVTTSAQTSPPKSPIARHHGLIWGTASLLAILFISLFSVIGLDRQQPQDYSKVKFSSYPISKGLPNSVVFDLSLDGIESRNLLIQQYWDKSKTIKINATQRQATGIYYYPGYFSAKLLVGGQIIKEHDLFIKAPNWMATLDYEPIPKYLLAEQLDSNGLAFPPLAVQEIAASEKPLEASFHLVDNLGAISGDDFTLRAAIKNQYRDKWAVCQHSRIVILGTDGAMVFPFSIPGCVSDLRLMLNDVFFSGKEHDLSVFGADFSDWRALQLRLDNKTVKVDLDQETIYTGRYYESIGRLVGLRFRFLGAGAVKDLEVVDEEGHLVLKR